jgi:ArpU family phage transcriptional regulator
MNETGGRKMKTNFTYRATEAILYKYRLMKIQIENDARALKEYDEQKRIGPSATDTTADKVTNSTITDTTFHEAMLVLEDKKRIERAIEKNTAVVKRVDRSLQILTSEENKIIEDKYFGRKKDYEIFMQLNMAASTYYRVKQHAVRSISTILFG